MNKQVKAISIFTLAMINVAAVASIRNWPAIAKLGTPAIFYLLLATFLFFIPTALVSAELATGWPSRGGVFAWVKEAFGHRTGFLAVWLLWIENVPFYPMLIAFISATVIYPFYPELVSNKIYTVSMIIGIFWLSTILNLFGMKLSSWLSTICVLVGTIFPGALIILFGLYWLLSGQPLQIPLTLEAVIPKETDGLSGVVLFVAAIMGFMGIEMSSVHVRDVENPRKNYPKAIFLSLLIILTISILGVIAIAAILPANSVSFTSGVMQAIDYMTKAIGLPWLTNWMAIFIAIGALGTLFTWTIGPTKGLLAAAMNGDLPPFFRRVNKRDVPVNMMITQALIVSALSLLFVLLPGNTAYWILVASATPLYLLMYLLLFASAIRLRYTKPNVERSYRIPGGNFGMWLVAGAGIVCSVLTILVSLIPSDDLKGVTIGVYAPSLAGGILLASLLPYIILRFQKPSWKKRLGHERLSETEQ